MRPSKSQFHPLRCGAVEFIFSVGVVIDMACRVFHGINSARESSSATLLFPSLLPLTELQPIATVTRGSLCAMALVAVTMLVVRPLVSRYFNIEITWTFSLSQYGSCLRYVISHASALATWAFAMVGTVLLVVVGLHAHVDRTFGKPIVVWQGPLQDYITPFAISGYAFLAAAYVYGLHRGNRSQGMSRFIFATGILFALAVTGISIFFLIGPDD